MSEIKKFDNEKILNQIRDLQVKIEELEETLEEESGDFDARLEEKYGEGYDAGIEWERDAAQERETETMERFTRFAQELLDYKPNDVTAWRKFVEKTAEASDLEDLPTKDLDLI